MKKTGLSRSRPKRKPLKRDWRSARAKVDGEGRCRVCKESWGLQTAHVIGREHDLDSRNGLVPNGDSNAYFVRPDRVIPLCGTCHTAYDRHEVEVLHVLTLDEQLQAVRDAGSVESMRRRTAPLAYRRSAA